MKEKAIICDFDGTLYQVTRRKEFIELGEWDKFHEAASQERPNQWCVDLLERFQHSHKILFVSGRPETYADEAAEWIAAHCDLPQDRYELLMAPPMMKDIEYKPKVYKEHIEGLYDVLLVLDDRPMIVDMWRKLGLICLQPNFVDH